MFLLFYAKINVHVNKNEKAPIFSFFDGLSLLLSLKERYRYHMHQH